MPLPALGPLAMKLAPVAGSFALNKLGNSGKEDEFDPHYGPMQHAGGLKGGFNEMQNSGFTNDSSKLATFGAAFAGASAAALKSWKGSEGESFKDRIMDAATDGLAGGVAGGALKMSHDAVQAEGGSFKATALSAVASAAASTLEKGGPSMLQSAMMGAGAGAASNFAHDKLTENGQGFFADGLGSAGLGASAGYAFGGDGGSAMMGAGAIGAAGLVDGFMSRAPSVEVGMEGMVSEESLANTISQTMGDGAGNQSRAMDADMDYGG